MFALFTKKTENYEPEVETEVNVKRKRPVLEDGWGIEFTMDNGDLKTYPIKVDHVEGGKVWFKDLDIMLRKDRIFTSATLTHYGQPIGDVPINAFPLYGRAGDSIRMNNISLVFIHEGKR